MRNFFVFWLMLLSGNTFSQTKPAVFANCATQNTRCYRDYLVQTITNCSFVWDAANADVQILITEKPNSTGGVRLNLEFTGMKTLVGKKDTLFCDIPQGQTDDFTRTNLVETIQLGLLHIFHHTLWQGVFKAQRVEGTAQETQKSLTDKWNYWNFTPGINGYTEGQSNSLFLRLNAEIAIRRVTDKSKFILNGRYSSKRNSITLDDEKLAMHINSLNFIPLYVRSLNNHWSVGVTGQYQQDEYKNLLSSYRIAPVLEYNIFPYTANAQKQLRIVYQAGLHNFTYYGTTIFNKNQERKPYQRLTVITDITRNWGSLRGSIQSSSFLDYLKQNRLTFTSLIAIRIAKGLSFNVEGQFELVNDQISLLKEPLNGNVYILGGQQLPTKSYFWAEFGFTYTFGSIFSSIVNPRMGQIDEIEF
ncbi:hypothetical protein [Runella limosa]|uniref:hypothetical protein n=1 Tax=Runella limosa TaxID=370978 RepID=UPI00048BEA03|nr:hypothetical protein [Runella limosa]